MGAGSPLIRRLIRNFPGFKTFGIYAFLPVFYVMGAGLEFTMIHWTVGTTNFYSSFKRRQARERAEAIIQEYLQRERALEN